jgi:S-adenosylmethionine decarboxylase
MDDKPLGRHIIIDVWGDIGSYPFWNMDATAEVLKNTARKAGATVLTERWHHFGDGHGYTGVVVLAESHISVHTWPEKGYAALDIFMCGDCNPEDCEEDIKSFYKPSKYFKSFMRRGD